MRIRYPALQPGAVDVEDHQNRLVIPGEWRRGRNMQDVVNVEAPNRDTKRAKKQRLYLKHYLNSPAGSVPWQDRMIQPTH